MYAQGDLLTIKLNRMTNKELELIGQLTEVVIAVAQLKAENKILKDINEKLMQALRIHDVVGRSEQLPQNFCTLNRQTCGKGSGCKYPHCHL